MAKIKDLVCDMSVDVAGAKYISEQGGAVYYFCAPGCKAAFDREPQRYISEALKPNGGRVAALAATGQWRPSVVIRWRNHHGH